MGDSDEGYDTVDAMVWKGANGHVVNNHPPVRTVKPSSYGVHDVTSGSTEYRMNHKRRGLALIINNKDFSGGISRRAGTDIDAGKMTHTLTKLGFDVDKVSDVTTDSLQAALMTKAESDYSDRDCFLCVIMTHGDEDHVWGTDGRKIHLKTLISYFGGNRCPTLVGKPKIFIINACQGEKVDEGHVVSDSRAESGGQQEHLHQEGHFRNLPYELDFLYIHSTVNGYYSYRNTTKGSFFITQLCEVLDQFAEKQEICKLLTLVNRRVAIGFESKSRSDVYNAKKQCPCFLSLLTKQLYFRQSVKQDQR